MKTLQLSVYNPHPPACNRGRNDERRRRLSIVLRFYRRHNPQSAPYSRLHYIFDGRLQIDHAMHFTISPFGSAGDVFPFLGLALKLRDRGHDISFVTSGYFEESVRRHGLEYIELGTKEEFLEAVNHPDLWSQTRGFMHIFHGLAAVFRRHYEILQRQYHAHNTVAVSSILGFGGRIAQEKLQIPLVSVHLQPAVIFSKIEPPRMGGLRLPRWLRNVALRLGERLVFDRIACPELNRFRAELGLEPMSGLIGWAYSKHKNVCLFPDWFAPPQTDWPQYTETSDFPLWDDRANEPLACEVQSFLDSAGPPIVFTPGSANKFGAGFFKSAVDACLRLGRPGILLTRFPEQIPPSLPSSIRHFDYVPLASLLPHVAAIVHHGGIGTTAQGLATGIPQLVMPLAHDQFDNAVRVQRMGTGDWLHRRQFKAPAVAKKLNRLLDAPSVRLSCQEVSQKLDGRHGLDLAADAIEEFGMQRMGN